MQLDLSRFSPAERSTLQLRVLYEGAGYRKFRCSHFEEYSLYQQNERFLSDSQVITFTDLDGKLRAIKPDVTLSIAKNAQPTAGECKKYYYTEQICRPSRESHTFSEISQMSLECIGAVGAAEQAEVVRLALESLASLEVPTRLCNSSRASCWASPRLCALRWKAWPVWKFPPCWKSAIWAL